MKIVEVNNISISDCRTRRDKYVVMFEDGTYYDAFLGAIHFFEYPEDILMDYTFNRYLKEYKIDDYKIIEVRQTIIHEYVREYKHEIRINICFADGTQKKLYRKAR